MATDIEITFEDFIRSETENQVLIGELLKPYAELFVKFFDVQQKLFYNHFPGIMVPAVHFQEHERVAMQSYLKITLLLFNCHQLILKGNFGVANTLQRQIFEYLLLGKYSSVQKNSDLANKWFESSQFDVYDKIIKRFDPIKRMHFHEFWKVLCRQAHATTTSLQIGLSFEAQKREIFTAYQFLLLYQRCNYHLLNTHFLNKKLRYYSSKYGFHEKENKQLKIEANKLKKDIYSLYSSEGKALIRYYEIDWV